MSDTVKWTDVEMTAYRKLENKLEKVYDTPYYQTIFENYTLSSLLSIYGVPDNVYIFLDTGIANMGLGVDLYILHLNYPKQGWVAHLEMPLHDNGSSFVGCPNEAFTSLRVWSPDYPSRDYELDPSSLFTIEEATELSIHDFYQKFKDPTNKACLETSANIHK